MIEDATSRNTDLVTKVARLNGGFLKFYSAPRPSGLTTTTLLGTCGINATAATVAGAVATFNAISPDNSPAGNGDAVYALACDSGGVAHYNLSVGLTGSGADIIVDNQTVVAGVPSISVSSLTFTAPPGT